MENQAQKPKPDAVFGRIAKLLSSGYCDRCNRISEVIKEIFTEKMGKSVSFAKLRETDTYSNLLVGYNEKRNVWVIAVYNRLRQSCEGYIYNPAKEYDYYDIPMCNFNFGWIGHLLAENKLKYRVFTREEVGPAILKRILYGYYDMGG